MEEKKIPIQILLILGKPQTPYDQFFKIQYIITNIANRICSRWVISVATAFLITYVKYVRNTEFHFGLCN